MNDLWVPLFIAGILIGIAIWLLIWAIIQYRQAKEEERNFVPKITIYKVIKDNLIIAICPTHEEALLIRLQKSWFIYYGRYFIKGE